MENEIKKQQLDWFSDRTSATRFAVNQLRLQGRGGLHGARTCSSAYIDSCTIGPST